MPLDLTVPVAGNQDLGHGNFLLEFDAAAIAAEMAPGQFFMIGVPHADVLLRRPFSVAGLPGTFGDTPGRLHVLYKVVGAGTALLASLKSGATLQVLGPLGKGFTVPPPGGAAPVLVAGGIGSAPFPALARALAARGHPARLLYGARTAGDLPLLDWFRSASAAVEVTTDDGSVGRRGFVTAPLEAILRAHDPRAIFVYACGPEPMLRRVAALTIARGVGCELALEAHMACGFGVCLGCVVPTRTGRWGDGGYDRVCVEGPVMRAETLAW